MAVGSPLSNTTITTHGTFHESVPHLQPSSSTLLFQTATAFGYTLGSCILGKHIIAASRQLRIFSSVDYEEHAAYRAMLAYPYATSGQYHIRRVEENGAITSKRSKMEFGVSPDDHRASRSRRRLEVKKLIESSAYANVRLGLSISTNLRAIPG